MMIKVLPIVSVTFAIHLDSLPKKFKGEEKNYIEAPVGGKCVHPENLFDGHNVNVNYDCIL